MREIKFRAWTDNLKDGGAMYYSYHNKNSFNPLFSPAGYGLDNPTLIIMQYTGLKDKNGKEIYEGDIVKCSEKEEVWVGEVRYLAPEFTVWIESDPRKAGHSIFPLGLWIKTNGKTEVETTYEVIGNIYENKELLNSR